MTEIFNRYTMALANLVKQAQASINECTHMKRTRKEIHTNVAFYIENGH